ncbi:hypothetical protein EW093_09105 [Thiospirochaeta perfilievii]|uniref:Response regulatory domain-containing protein n=1 Tax=Thiospirochaeta perfilievii TaxID=252967 RepID=A0A5C1Q9X7_9SPIO|nr:SpoIIE family protein phosphatase [Thiospirochaeta perfilievii]QEN04855.1 hypothetical protein EW093_09105 [Thiospirochaeta perfilievii]
MITSNRDKENSNEGFDAGVDNFLTKPIDPDTLSITLKVATRIIDIHQKLAYQLNLQKEEIARAKEIQQLLYTREIPSIDNVNIRALYKPSQEMGGDFFNIIKTVRGNLAVILVDCTGHGLEASMFATLLKSICDRHLYLLDNPKYLANFVQMVNIDAAGYLTSDQFPVMFVSIYDPVSMKFFYSSANGEHPYLIRNKEAYPLQRAMGMHLGYNTESQYVVKSFKVKPNDIIIYYSDAIIEIKDAIWDRSKDEILKNELAQMGKNLTKDHERFMNFIFENTRNNSLDDDLSLIYFQIKESKEYTTYLYTRDDLDREISCIKNDLFEYDYNYDESEKIVLAVRELILNAIEHGNTGDPSKKVTIEHTINCRYVEFVIEDEGNGFDEKLVPEPTDRVKLQKMYDNNEEGYKHGRGIWLTRRLMNSLKYVNNGRKAITQRKKDKVYTYNNFKTPIDNM